MRSESPRGALGDIRENMLHAQAFVAGLDYASFAASRRDFYATTRAIEILSEASRRLPEDLRSRHPGIPRRDIRDVGNFYRRQYDNVAESYVWRTVQEHLPPLLAVVEDEPRKLEEMP